MARFVFAAAAALALVAAQPARACEDCKNCPHHRAAATEKSADEKPAACTCPGSEKGCKCGPKCECPHCHGTKAEKADEKKES